MANRGGPVDVLLVAAHRLELEPLVARLGPALQGELGSRRVAAVAVGVGMTAAGAGAANALREHRPAAAVLLGSYGVYPGHGELEPGRLLVPAEVRAVDAAVLRAEAAFPEPMPVSVTSDVELREALARSAGGAALQAVLATTLAITTSDALAIEIGARSGCLGENLEALAVGVACHAASVPFACVVACTNRVGSEGRNQWRQHHALAAQSSCACVVQWLLGS